ncbi:olfactory receptor 14A16-like [Protobothrops mucrosquamatus]|uniref:olfactory receptor 14A16-like n=1 Tax=Protobothrops mucrosquamatus TaxID=103944 RepID=UPI000775AC2A|nr:olfactory receptor 14A16-like [Protobothrops mucrosquamatus]
MENKSRVSEFLLHGFPNSEELRIVHIIVFLIIYLVALIENLIIITVVVYSHQLHSPMYFFLVNLSLQDLSSISVTVPKSMMNSLMNTEAISYSGCLCQVFFLVFFMLSHFFLLGIMAYDRYVAICSPLRYESILSKKACIQMATSAWMGGLCYAILYTGNLFTVKFCSRIINQFFCEIPQLLKISCFNSYVAEEEILILGSSLGFIVFALIVFSYVKIFQAVLQIPSTQGKQKAFSTCLPHLIVICFFLVSGTFAYLKPTSSSPSTSDILVSMFYCVVPPVMNPLIYSMRNKELKMAIWKLIFNIFSNTLSQISQFCIV